MGYNLEFRKPNGYFREKMKFDTLEEAKQYVFDFVKQNEDFYKTCKSIDSGCFDILPDFEYGKDSVVYRIIATEDHYQNPEYFEMKEELVDSFIYRNIPVNIYEDDYGQCYYFRFVYNGEMIENSCGGWNPDYKSETTDAIDCMLDRSEK